MQEPRGAARPDGSVRGARPNVVIIVLDDLGFAQLGCFGSDVETPHLDRLAGAGLRFNGFHVTALCSPTRACVLTGRNSHAVGMGFVPDAPSLLPGYTGSLPGSAATVARVLRDSGYATSAIGKWHLTPRDERTSAGPFGQWPLGQGFERFYGFLHAETNQWTPLLVSDNHYVDPPRTPQEGYHLTEDLVDRAIGQVFAHRQAAPMRPFFLYFAPGAMHAPHQVAPAWSERYAGAFDDGWEQWRERAFGRQVGSGLVPTGTRLTPRPPWVPAWGDLSADERRLFARTQEVFAGFLTHTDHQIGRFVTALEELGVLDDTLLLVLSDNGASAEGGPFGSVNEKRFMADRESLTDNLAGIDGWGGHDQYNHYAWGWAWAGNTPFRLWKRYAWLGGTRTPLIVHWPHGIADAGRVREQFCHAVDIAPTVMEACGVAPPAAVDGITQQRIDGASLVEVFRTDDAPSPRGVQYFEILGSRSIYRDGWKATTNRVVRGLGPEQRLMEGSHELAEDRWSLFDLSDDFSESRDVAAEHPAVLRDLQQLWWAEAGRNQVLPMHEWFDPASAVPPTARGTVFRPEGGAVADEAVPSLGAGGEVHVDVDVPEGDVHGVLCAHGDWTAGWALYVVEGKVQLALNVLGTEQHVRSDRRLDRGPQTIRLSYRPADDGESVTLWQGDEPVAERVFPAGTLTGFQQTYGSQLRLGHDAGFPVSREYTPPFPWTGTVHAVSFRPPVGGTRDAEGGGIAEVLRRD